MDVGNLISGSSAFSKSSLNIWNFLVHIVLKPEKKVLVAHFSHVQLFATPWTIAHQGPLSMLFSRQGYWSGLPFPSPDNLPNQGVEPRSPAVQLKPSLENFEHYFASVWDECNCMVVCSFFGLAFLWDWNENWPFPILWPLLSFPNLLAYWVQHFHSIIF